MPKRRTSASKTKSPGSARSQRHSEPAASGRANVNDEATTVVDADSPPSATSLAWQLVLRRLPAIVWTTDRRLRITSVGGAAFGELSFHANSLIGRQVADCFASANGTAISVLAAHELALAGEATTLECDWNRKVFRILLEPMSSPVGRREGCVGMAIDVTPCQGDKSQKCRSERLATLTGFAAGLAHEVNNSLGAALSNTQAALNMLPESGSPLLKECLDDALESVRRCSGVVRSLLRFCCEEPAHRCECDLVEAARIAATITRSYAAEHKCRLELKVGGTPQIVLGSALQLEMVFVNLVRFAVEAGASHITLSPGYDARQVVFHVSDNGRGISGGDVSRLRDPSFTARGEHGHARLGLDIVHKILQEHGGTLTFSPQSPCGTLVSIALPHAVPEE